MPEFAEITNWTFCATCGTPVTPSAPVVEVDVQTGYVVPTAVVTERKHSC